jgi:hypothetical protein
MSAGPFLISKYARNDDGISPIRIQPETLMDGNAAPDGGSDGPFVKISGSRRAYGLHPRKVTLARSVGDADYGTAKVYAKVVILTVDAFDAYVIGSTIVYSGVDWVVASKTSESIR